MSAAKYDMSIDQGADFTLKLTIRDPLGALVDLTGHTFSGQIRKTISDASVVASFSFNVLDQITNTGEVEISLASATSSAIVLPTQKEINRKEVKYPYDVESVDGSGVVVRWLQGIVKISPEVTR